MIGPSSKSVVVGSYVLGFALGGPFALILAKLLHAAWLLALVVPLTMGIASVVMHYIGRVAKSGGTEKWFKMSSGRH